MQTSRNILASGHRPVLHLDAKEIPPPLRLLPSLSSSECHSSIIVHLSNCANYCEIFIIKKSQKKINKPSKSVPNYIELSKNIKIILRGKATCRCHRMKQKNGSGESWPLVRAKWWTRLSDMRFYYLHRNYFLWRRHVAFPTTIILIFFGVTRSLLQLMMTCEGILNSRQICPKIDHFCIILILL
jgi:hypothetical protein